MSLLPPVDVMDFEESGETILIMERGACIRTNSKARHNYAEA